MNNFEEKYEQQIITAIDVLEYILSTQQHILKKRKHYAEHQIKEDISIKQYIDLKKEKEQELYILLLQLNAQSELFEIRFKSVANAIASEEAIPQNWWADLQPYLKKLKILLGEEVLEPQS